MRAVGQEYSVCCTGPLLWADGGSPGKEWRTQLIDKEMEGLAAKLGIPRVKGVYFTYHPGMGIDTYENCSPRFTDGHSASRWNVLFCCVEEASAVGPCLRGGRPSRPTITGEWPEWRREDESPP